MSKFSPRIVKSPINSGKIADIISSVPHNTCEPNSCTKTKLNKLMIKKENFLNSKKSSDTSYEFLYKLITLYGGQRLFWTQFDKK